MGHERTQQVTGLSERILTEKIEKRIGQPQVVWIELPYHDNFNNNCLRECFNKALNDTAKLHEGVAVFQLKKVWDPVDTNLYLRDADRFTALGLRSYWEAVDKTVRFCDTTIMRRIAKTEFKNSFPVLNAQRKPEGQDRYRWRAPTKQFKGKNRPLPPPPATYNY